MPAHIDWLIVGDFNLIRKPEDINREVLTSMKCICSMKQLVL